VLSPENGSFASVAPREAVASGCIDASTATSGPHAFAVRVRCARLSQLPRPPHPRPSLRRWPTPLRVGRYGDRYAAILASDKAKYFLYWGLTRFRISELICLTGCFVARICKAGDQG